MAAAHQVATGIVSYVIRAVALTSLILASPASFAAPLQPTDKWVVNYEDAQCNGYRNYGTEKDPLYLAFKAPPAGDVVQLMVLQNGPRMAAEQQDINVRVGDRKTLRTNMLVYRGRKGKFRTKLINLPRAEFVTLRQADKVVIFGKGQDYAFSLSDVGPFMKALDACVVDLRDFYNVGVPDLPNSKLSSGPVGNLQPLFSGKDYPWSAVINRLGGTTSLEVLVDDKGAVADCSVTGTSGNATIDAQSCAIITDRAKFQPALDPQGKATRSSFSQRITWRVAN